MIFPVNNLTLGANLPRQMSWPIVSSRTRSYCATLRKSGMDFNSSKMRLSTTMQSKLILKVLKGPIEGQIFTFDEHDTFIFGRANECHARLPEADTTASRHHFILEVNPPDACIRDLGSLNGTHVNQSKIGGRSKGETPEDAAQRKFPVVNLHDGDEIRVGETVFTFGVDSIASCRDCGTAIAKSDQKACEWAAGVYVCAACSDMALKKPAPQAQPKAALCTQCAKDVAAEVGQADSGTYVCQDCREKAEANPLDLLLKLVHERAGPRGESGLASIPGYELGKMLGQGGMGAVYFAKRQKDGAAVALKVMLAKIAVSDYSRKMFLREIDVTRSLRHENIVEFHDTGSVGGAFYVVLEFCSGGSLSDYLKSRNGRLSLSEAAPIMMDSLAGLAHAHDNGFVHRDLKPPNILLSGREGNFTAKIADMGLAKNFTKAGYSGMTATGSYGGSYPFMPREQVTNFKFVKPVSDVWSIGATFYFLLTRQYPRAERRGQDPIDAILKGEVVPIRKHDPAFPSKLAEVIDRSLANKVPERYQNAAEMRKAMEQAL